MISKRKVDKIGDILKKWQTPSSQEYKDLLNWRNGYSEILDYYFIKLSSIINKNENHDIARRLKRIESIQIKLKRFKTMRLSTLQDIAGLRAVLHTEEQVMETFTQLRSLSSKYELKKVNNYHHIPKKDGYRGIHFVYQGKDSKQIEIQLRSELEHIWSTGVEIYGELQNTSFKTGEGEEEWKDFFKLLSSYFAIKEQCNPLEEHMKLKENKIRSKLKKSIDKLKVIEKLGATTNNLEMIISKHNQKGRMGRHALVEMDLKNQMTHVEIFNKKDIPKAIEIYTQKELSYQKNELKNIVFVNIEDIEKLKRLYPNYFMNTQKLLEILSKIMLNQF